MTRDAVGAVDARLDATARARMRARIEEQRQRSPSRLRGPLVWLSIPLGAALALLAAPALRAPTPPSRVASEPPAILRPVGQSEASNRVVVAAGEQRRLQIAERARLTLSGSAGGARLDVDASSPALIVLRLRGGTLVADWNHAVGGTLRIEAPGFVVEVVGTLFQVSAGRSPRVSVQHGAVAVRPANAASLVLRDGEAWTAADGQRAALSDDDQRAFAEHERAVWEPRPDDPPSVGTSATDDRVAAAAPQTSKDGTGPTAGPPSARPPAAVRARPEARRANPQERPAAEAPSSGVSPRSAEPGIALPAPPSPRTEPATTPNTIAGAGAPPRTATAATAYAEAERSLRAGDAEAAMRHLTVVIDRFPEDALADEARFELTRLLGRAGRRREALAQLHALIRNGRNASLVESAELAVCRLALEDPGQRDEGMACLRSFRGKPRSGAQDAAALVLLWSHVASARTCDEGRAYAEEYLRRYPGGPAAPDARALVAECSSR